jgi:hypothetical protein
MHQSGGVRDRVIPAGPLAKPYKPLMPRGGTLHIQTPLCCRGQAWLRSTFRQVLVFLRDYRLGRLALRAMGAELVAEIFEGRHPGPLH